MQKCNLHNIHVWTPSCITILKGHVLVSDSGVQYTYWYLLVARFRTQKCESVSRVHFCLKFTLWSGVCSMVFEYSVQLMPVF